MVLVFGALRILYGRMDPIREIGHYRDLCSNDAIPLSVRVDAGGPGLSLGQTVQDREERLGNCLWYRDRSAGGHRGPGFFCGLPHRWKYFSDSGCYCYVPTHYGGPGCFGPAGKTHPPAYHRTGLCSRSLRAVLILGYEYTDLVRTRYRGPVVLGDRRVVPKALHQLSLGRDGPCLAHGRVFPARPLALSSGIDSRVLEPQLGLCPAKLVSERSGGWALLAAMKHGGKASIVVPFTALYPLVTVSLAPFLLDEAI